MPIYANSGRKSIIPDFYKRISLFAKEPHHEPKDEKVSCNYGNRKSSPYPHTMEHTIPDIKSDKKNSALLLQAFRASLNFKRKISLHKRKYKSIHLEKISDESVKPENETPKPEKRKIINNIRKSEFQRRSLTEKNNAVRHSLQIKKCNTIQEKKTGVEKEENELALMCQLLLIRTVTPQLEIEDVEVSEEFDQKLDERYFEYYPQIFRYLCEREQLIKFNNNYLSANNFTSSFRSILIDWLIKVQIYSKIRTESLQVAVTLLDMFTSVALIKRSFYQLVGVTSLLIACKVVQRFHPKIKDLCYLTDNSYQMSHVLQMESIMLEKLDFFVNVPIACNFHHRGLLACVEIMDTNQLDIFCSYMFDLIILDPSSPSLKPSCKAAGALLIGRHILYPEYTSWTKILQHYTMYELQQLKFCVIVYIGMLTDIYDNKAYPYKAVLEKYSLPAWRCIAKEKRLIEFSKCKKAQNKLEQLFSEETKHQINTKENILLSS